MFIKLSFTADTRLTVPLRILTDIINTPSITSVSALQSRFTSASYTTTLTANFDAANSQIIRTTSPTNTIAHYSAYAIQPAYGDCTFTIEHSVYDNTSTKFYSQIASGSAAAGNSTYYFSLGDSITGGTIASNGLPLTVPETQATSSTDVKLTLGGTPLSFANAVHGPTTSGGNNIRTFWAYITDKCFVWATTNAVSYNNGFGSTYSDPTKFCGPFIVSQYTRYDYHNTNSNGIIPVMYSSPRGTGIGWGLSNGTFGDFNGTQNSMYTADTTSIGLRVYNLISAAPQIGSAWPKVYNPYVNVTAAGRANDYIALITGQGQGTITNQYAVTYAGALTTTASARFVNSTLNGNTFGLLPMGWTHTYYGNFGGNASDQGGFYIFNGDYVPGDTFLYNSIQYMVWPIYSGYSNRLGLAIPMT